MDSPFLNRLRKNFRHFRRWAQKQNLGAYRVYDLDLPEVPFVVEWFEGRVHLVEFARRGSAAHQEQLRAEVLTAVCEVLEVAPERVFNKTHEPKPWGRAQYSRESEGGDFFEVGEQGLRFWVNLQDYLDTGLFLDHRKTRAWIREEARGKRVLNLFCYTGSFTVYAAAGGARSTTSVDLSNTYLDWAERNLQLNGLSTPAHAFVRSDVKRWVEQAHAGPVRYDLIILDPPSFSASKKMTGTLNIQRDHVRMLRDTLSLLAPEGTLYFSTNYRNFQLQPEKLDASFQELTPQSLPEDFHQRDIHRCWRVRRA